MGESDFVKSKMHFTIGLLAAVFALHPFFPQFDAVSFSYAGTTVPLSWAFLGIGVLLAGAVYFYATDLMNEHNGPMTLSQRLGNYFYALALMMVPFYAGMYLSTLLENYLIQHEVLAAYHVNTPALTVGILAFWLVLWQLGGFIIRRYLTKKDWTSRIDQMADREMDALKRAKEMLEAHHYDLAILQFHKAVAMRLTMAGMKRGFGQGKNPLLLAKKVGMVQAENGPWLDVIVKNAAVAQSTQPATEADALETAHATKKFLATVAV